MPRPFESQRTAFKRYLATSTTAATFNSTVFGATPTARILTPAQVALTNGIFKIGKSLISQFIFFGVGANNTTFDYRIWAVFRLSNADAVTGGEVQPSIDPNVLVQYAGGGTATLCQIAGATSGTAVLAAETFADTLTWAASSSATAPKGPITDAETAFSEGTSTVFSPTSTTSEGIAQLFVPCGARAIGWIVDFDMTGATSGNVLIMADDV